ncbi:MAG: RNA polymerase sigma factor [Aureispira sp.]
MTAKEKQQYFLTLYEPNHTKLLRYCESILKDSVEAQDVVSDTVLLAYEQLDKLKKEASFVYFLFGIARNLIRRLQRRKKFWGFFLEEQANQLPAPTAKPLNEDVQLLYQALDHLPAAQKEALILFELSGYSLKETAQIQGCSLSAVKARVTRGRQRLSKILSPNSLLAYE